MLNCFGCVEFGAVFVASFQLPIASCQWPVSSGCNQLPLLVLVAIAAASTHCCPFPLLLPAPTADQRPNIAILPMPNILSICMSSLGFCLCFVALLPSPPPYLLLSDCPQKAAQQKIEFPVRTDSIWRCNFTLCYCKVAATAGPGLARTASGATARAGQK